MNNGSKYHRTFSSFQDRTKNFIDLLDNSSDLFKINDSFVTSFYIKNIDIILFCLSLNFECTCTISESTFQKSKSQIFIYQPNKIILEVPRIPCTELKPDIIYKIIETITYPNSEFKSAFNCFIKKITEMVDVLKCECFTFKKLSKAYILFIKSFVDEKNINPVVIKKIVSFLDFYEYFELFTFLMGNRKFSENLNFEQIVRKKNYSVVVHILERGNLKTGGLNKVNWDHSKFIDELYKIQDEILDDFVECNSVIKMNEILYVIEMLLTDYDKDFFLKRFITLIESGKILNNFNDLHKNDVNLKQVLIDINLSTKELHLINILSLIAKFDSLELSYILEERIHFLELMFYHEDLFYLQKSITNLIIHILKKDKNHFRLIYKTHEIIKKYLCFWGREFFARENEKNPKMSALNAFLIFIYDQIKNCHILKPYFESDDFLFVKWYFDKNIKKGEVSIENGKHVEEFLDDCLCEAHFRYIYRIMLDKLPETDFFELI